MNTSEGHLISNDLERCFAMRKGERRERRYMYVVKKDMQKVGMQKRILGTD